MKITLKMKYLPIYQIYFLQIPYNPIPKYDNTNWQGGESTKNHNNCCSGKKVVSKNTKIHTKHGNLWALLGAFIFEAIPLAAQALQMNNNHIGSNNNNQAKQQQQWQVPKRKCNHYIFSWFALFSKVNFYVF